jgi:hypothetical protein
MEAKKAREIAEEVQKSGVNSILSLIEAQARKGQTGLSIVNYSSLNEPSRKILKEMGYSVKWQETGRDDGYWQINW